MKNTNRSRILSVKLDLRDLPDPRATYQRLRDLSWQAARYRNGFIRRRWAEAVGLRDGENEDDKHGVTKRGRATEKGELSGAAYSAAEREVQAQWQRHAKQILAGAPLPEWRTNAALSVRGHKHKKDSGVRLEWENGRYVLYLSAQSKHCDGGCWLRLPVAKHTERDKYQGDLLRKMIDWDVPIAKAAVRLGVKKRKAWVQLTYEETKPLPKMGKRVATLGPIEPDGKLHMRTETQSREYSHELEKLLDKKDTWDLIRRRAMRQIAWRKRQARIKRERIAALTPEDWINNHLHSWTRDVVKWCASQGVGEIRVAGLATGDWPEHRFRQMLTYKASDAGMDVTVVSDLEAPSTARAAKGALQKRRRKTKDRRDALRTIADRVSA